MGPVGDRREFLRDAGLGFGSLALTVLLQEEISKAGDASHPAAQAART